LGGLDVAAAGPGGPDRGGHRVAPGTEAPRSTARRGRAGLLAGGGAGATGAGPPGCPEAASRDEGARRGLVGVAGDADALRRRTTAAAGPVPPTRAVGSCLLVRAAALSPGGVRSDGALVGRAGRSPHGSPALVRRAELPCQAG